MACFNTEEKACPLTDKLLLTSHSVLVFVYHTYYCLTLYCDNDNDNDDNDNNNNNNNDDDDDDDDDNDDAGDG